MESFWLEFSFVMVLILANGFFAGAELAIVSARRGHIGRLAKDGQRRARAVEQLQADPHRFLATVQIGVTLVGTLASAIGGAAAVEMLKPLLQQAPLALVSNAAEPLALALVVGCIAYLSLIFGELVPKAMALEYSDRIALGVARPIQALARLGGPAVSLLTLSSRLVLRLLGIRASGAQAFLTQEEIQHMLEEGRETGAVTRDEHEIIRKVFAFSRTQVREVMVPRLRMLTLDLDRPLQELVRVVVESQYSRFPVYRGDVDNVVGFLHAKDLLGAAAQTSVFDLDALIRRPLFVPEAKKVNDLLRELQRSHQHMAMVVDEYGSISGLVTTEDLLEELVGEIEDEHDLGQPLRIQPLPEGGYQVDALLSLNDLKDLLGVRFPSDAPYETLAGLILYQLGRFPLTGEQLVWGGYRLTCVKTSPTAIRRVKIEPLSDSADT